VGNKKFEKAKNKEYKKQCERSMIKPRECHWNNAADWAYEWCREKYMLSSFAKEQQAIIEKLKGALKQYAELGTTDRLVYGLPEPAKKTLKEVEEMENE
jgi:hypothetical protein